MSKINIRLNRVLMICIILIIAFAALPADAQYVTLENGYLGVAIGQYAWYWQVSPALTHVMIDGGTIPMGGRFAIWTTNGDPTTNDDDGMSIVYSGVGQPGPGDKWGAWQVMVDGYDDDGLHAWATFEAGGTSGIWGDDTDGVLAYDGLPRIPSNENVIKGSWYPNPNGGVEVTEGRLPVRCDLETRLLRDTVRFKWTIKNEDMVDHLVGLRVYADLITSGEDTGTQDLRNVVSIPGQPLLENRIVLSGNDIPAYIDMVNSQMDPVISVRPTFRGNGATPPDKVGIDDWRIVADPSWTYGVGNPSQVSDPFNTWLYEPLPYRVIDDLGYGAFWKPRRLAPGQSMTIIHYLGLGCATSDFTRPSINKPQYVAAVQGPRTLKYHSDEEGTGWLYPSPFTVTAYMENQEKYTDLRNVSFTLMLPQGLTLDASEGGKYTKTMNRIRAGEEGSVSWSVRVANPFSNATGIQKYSVSFTADPAGGTTVSREINIPATEWQPLSKRWQMISVPFNLTHSYPSDALGLIGAEGTDYKLWQYNPYLKEYQQVYSLAPGQAYWLWLSEAQNTEMTTGRYMPIQWSGTQGHQISLQTGWNMIGNPYVYAVTFGELRFYHVDHGTIDYDQAIARGLINKTIFWYDTVFRKYAWSSLRSAQFKPWQGYWVRAMKPGVTMIITPVSQLGASLGGVPESDDDNGGGTPPPSP